MRAKDLRYGDEVMWADAARGGATVVDRWWTTHESGPQVGTVLSYADRERAIVREVVFWHPEQIVNMA